MSPNHVIPLDSGALSPIAESVMRCESLTYDVGCESIVIAVRSDLIVNSEALAGSAKLREALEQIAEFRGSLADVYGSGREASSRSQSEAAREPGAGKEPDPDYEPPAGGPLTKVELWRLEPTRDAIDESRRLRRIAGDDGERPGERDELRLPAVSPNHVAILSPHASGCPATPPQPAPAPTGAFVEPPASGPVAKVTILDSGYIEVPAPNTHHNLDARVVSVPGQALDTSSNPPTWLNDKPDGTYTDPAGRLDGISGHGTFIAGLIAHIAPQTRIEVVGLRNQEVEIGALDPAAQLGLFETEAAIAHAMLRRSDTDVIQCGFSFPTLDDYPSLPFAAVMAELRQPTAPRGGHVAVVAPAGNEQARQRYWPSALPDVIGVASTNRRGNARAWFSNWGDWCDCCARGEHVYSTFVDWDGPVEGEPLSDIEHFRGWARWNGTSFAAPKVAARIAALVAADPGLPPTAAWELLVSGADVEAVTDYTLSPHHGVALPRIPDLP
ncbi:MAG TPA: S8/S53 family peptidase [Solirubrobacteraceae bacterium]|nr:S8/S53 family peptidase [Solirubrobacteraceae bacterium]